MDEYRAVTLAATPEGRILSGVAVPYEVEADVRGMRERFARGSAASSGMARLNIDHNLLQPIAEEPASLAFESRADGLHFRATLPDTPQSRALVQMAHDGALKGASVEFRAVKQRVAEGVRVIEEAIVNGLALAIFAKPLYEGAGVTEARADATPPETPVLEADAGIQWWQL
ncbi:MAG: hypothetical protein F4Y04_05300 [Chloroflexi bacterium]|nr:hypothetical protein [Chloroflexota bacterium]